MWEEKCRRTREAPNRFPPWGQHGTDIRPLRHARGNPDTELSWNPTLVGTLKGGFDDAGGDGIARRQVLVAAHSFPVVLVEIAADRFDSPRIGGCHLPCFGFVPEPDGQFLRLSMQQYGNITVHFYPMLDRVAARCGMAEERQRLCRLSEELLQPPRHPDSPFATLDEAERGRVEHAAVECANLFSAAVSPWKDATGSCPCIIMASIGSVTANWPRRRPCTTTSSADRMAPRRRNGFSVARQRISFRGCWADSSHSQDQRKNERPSKPA